MKKISKKCFLNLNDLEAVHTILFFDESEDFVNIILIISVKVSLIILKIVHS